MENNTDFVSVNTGGFNSLQSRGNDPVVQVKASDVEPTKEINPKGLAKASPNFKKVANTEKVPDKETEKKAIAENSKLIKDEQEDAE